jgi:adenine-specific DNA-methyltransferase
VPNDKAKRIRQPHHKRLGQYFTPHEVAACLMAWLIRRPTDEFLDPACGDGRFLRLHTRATGIDLCGLNCSRARLAAPKASVREGDFFAWAEEASERFDAVGGNPPFIRYQNFAGPTRQRAARLAESMGARLSGLASSWAPFVLVAARSLKPGGRLAFVVPAEIGHASYSEPLIRALCRHFGSVNVLAVRRKMFPELSEDAWLLYAEGYGSNTRSLGLTAWEAFRPGASLPTADKVVCLADWERNGCRLRKHLLSDALLSLYREAAALKGVRSLGEMASVSIGYVTGANDFFHLAPTQIARLGIPMGLTRVAVRKGDQLPPVAVTRAAVAGWLEADLPVLLLHLATASELPPSVRAYLDSAEGRRARQRYKCRVRHPWYVVPDVRVPDGFLSYMSGREPSLVRNDAQCVATNSLHVVHLRDGARFASLQRAWRHPLSRLSQELEGHPLGGGMLKLEPREASRVLMPVEPPAHLDSDTAVLTEGLQLARRWRHVA